jgi:polyisoprenoid-binding protein YceI
MRRALRLTAFPVVLLLAGIVDAETYSIDATHSAVDFSIRHMVGRTKGRFDDFAGTIKYDAANPGMTAISGTIQATSINTGNEKRDGHLRSEDFFFVDKHPTITFTSTKVAQKSDGMLQVTGNLTMRGVSKQVTLVVEVLGTGTNPRSKKLQIGLATQIELKRSDFGVDHWTDTAGVVGDEVKIEILIEAGAN